MHKPASGTPSNSMGGGEDTPPAAGGFARRGRYDEDDEEAEVGCMGATGGNRDAARTIARRRRLVFLMAALFIVVLALFFAGAVVLMEESTDAEHGAAAPADGLGYAKEDALGMSEGECSAKALSDMARASGVDVSRVRIAEFPCKGCDGGKRRGLAATVDIAEGTPIVEAEWRAVLSGEQSVGELREVFEVAKGMSMKERLALKLMYHRFLPTSELRPYICSIPPVVDTPLMWSDEKLKSHYKDWSEMQVRAKSAKMYLLQEYNKYMPLLFAKFPKLFTASTHTFSVWLWAMQAVKSRNWAVNRESEPAVSTAMVPFVDMINHDMGLRGAARTNLDGSKFTILAWKNYSKGDEVFTSYGDDCNHYYRLSYGFEIPGNTHPCLRVNASKSWKDKEDALLWHWATSGIGSNSVLPSKGAISATSFGGGKR